jgi:hypothetical protein
MFSNLLTPAEALVHRLELCQGIAQAGNQLPTVPFRLRVVEFAVIQAQAA